MMALDPDEVFWFRVMWLGRWQLVDVCQEQENLVLDCLESLELRNLYLDILAMASEGSLGTKGGHQPNMISQGVNPHSRECSIHGKGQRIGGVSSHH